MDRALLVGATGMVGSALVAAAEALPLTIIARREAVIRRANLTQVIADPAQWAGTIADLKPFIVLNSLGTTIKQAGSQAAFRAVDHDLVLAVAQAAKAAGTRHFISVSSVGASAKSSNFYLKTKGEVEAALRALNFDRLDIIRPGLLTGERGGPARPGESIGMMLAPFTDALMMLGSARRYRSVPAVAVARAMVALAKNGGTGVHVHEHDAIVTLAN
jgi:uncharacterized protein YbjT (DUF2867 family)